VHDICSQGATDILRHHICRELFMNTLLQKRWLILLTVGIGLCCVHVRVSAAPEQARATAAAPLNKTEFDAAVAEARRRMRHEDPVGETWSALDRDKLARLLQMPDFAALGDSIKAPFIDQAGAWELMPFSRPSEAQAMWARWYPNRGIDKPVGPNDRSVESPHVFYADEKWAPEAGAMIALLRCLPAAAWHVQHQEPMLWVMERHSSWDVPNTHDFGMCVRKQREDGGPPWRTSPDTPRGKVSASVLEKKFSEYLLDHRCSGKGPDSCLVLLHALQSLSPQHDKLVAILKALEPEFALAEEVEIPDALKDRRGSLTDAEFKAIMAQRRIAVRKAIFLTAKLPVLLQKPSEWPADELEQTLRVLLKLTLTMQRTAAIQAVLGDGLALGGWPFSSPWARLPNGGTMLPVAQTLTKLGREYAQPSGCDLANSHVGDLPAPFWIGYGLEKLEKEQTSCGAFSSYTEVAKLYAAAAKENKPQLLEPIGELRKFLDKEGPARDDVVNALGPDCPKAGEAAQPDPWNVCRLAAMALADAERKRRLSEPPVPVEPAKCTEGLEMDVALDLGYPEDQPRRTACRLMPGDKSKSIVALSLIRKDPAAQVEDDNDMGDYDLDVLIVQSGDGKALSHLHLDNVYASDAWRFSGIGIDTARYNLAPGVRAFGVRATHEGSSRVFPAGETTLNLYIDKDKRIRQILSSGLVVSKSRGESDMQCSGNYSQTERTIKMGKSVSHGFADLIVTSTTVNTESTMIKGECSESSQKPKIEYFTLRYDGNTYFVPPELRELQ
jgi:hypothetical protein